jgi:hypothetical protein
MGTLFRSLGYNSAVRSHIVETLIILNLLVTGYLTMEVYQLKKTLREHADRKKAALESKLMKASTLLKTDKTEEAKEIVDQILNS